MWSSDENSAATVIETQNSLLVAPNGNSSIMRRDPSISRFTVAKVASADNDDGDAERVIAEKNIPNNHNLSESLRLDIRKLENLFSNDQMTTTPPMSSRSASVRQVQFMVGVDIDDAHMTDGSRSTSYATQDASYRNIQTVEKVPCIDHYRDMLSVAKAMSSRPTLAELHEGTNLEMEIQDEAHEEAREELQKLSPTFDPATGSGPPKLGWIQGVLVRCILCIIGVMLYLRLSWVAGQAGIALGIVIVLLASTVTTLTALSLCAIATNGEVKGGGAYFLISRSLGPEFGGSIGVIFSFANAVAAAMYVVGFAESVRDLMKEHGALIVDGSVNDVRIISLGTIVLLLGIVIIGVQFETKAQIGLLGILCVSVCSFLIGSFLPPSDKQKAMGITGYSWTTAERNFHPSWRHEDFFSVFSVYFPAATGIMAGANISGDLSDPQKAIPKGTLLAIVITSVIYVLVVVVTGSTCLREASGDMAFLIAANSSDCSIQSNCTYGLLHSSQILEQISICGPLVIAGVFAATLSSALASMVSAPKVFQALCKDKLFPYIGHFGRGYGRGDEPRQAYLLAFAIAASIILIGDLNSIAPIISNFFLASYALINYACFDASFANSPGFRPAFKYYNMWLSLFGALICMAVMFLINWWTALITYALILALYVYLLRRKPEVNWGSSSQAHAYRNALNAMLRLVHTEEHVKNYRPQILLLTGNPASRQVLLEFASNITKETSLLICGQIIVHPQPEKMYATLQKLHVYVHQWLHKHKLRSFYLPVAAETLDAGAEQLMQLSGLGKLRPNIVLLGFKSDWTTCPIDQVVRYVNIIHHAFDCCYGVGVLRLPKGCDMSSQLKSLSMIAESDTSCMLSVHASDMVACRRQHNATTPSTSPQHNTNIQFPSIASFPNVSAPCQIRIQNDDTTVPVSHDSTRPICTLTKSATTSSTLAIDQLDSNRKTSSDEVQRSLWISFDDERKSLFKNPALLSYIEQFNKKIKKPVVDVWWLFDDGGLTLLIPHLLTLHKSYLEGARLRMFTIASSQNQLEQEQRSMAALLSKFRIDYSDVYVIPDIAKKPKNESLKEFNNLIAQFRENANSDIPKAALITDAELAGQKEKNFTDSTSSNDIQYIVHGVARDGHEESPAAYVELLRRMHQTLKVLDVYAALVVVLDAVNCHSRVDPENARWMDRLRDDEEDALDRFSFILKNSDNTTGKRFRKNKIPHM